MPMLKAHSYVTAPPKGPGKPTVQFHIAVDLSTAIRRLVVLVSVVPRSAVASPEIAVELQRICAACVSIVEMARLGR